MNTFAKTLVSAAVMTTAMTATTVTVQAADRVLLKTPIAFGSHLPALGTPIKWVSEQLPIMSEGSLKMKIYEPGKLVGAKEILGAVSSGKVNSGYATAGYWQGKIPAAALFSAVPFGPEAGEYMAWLYYGNGLKLYQEMYDTNGYNVKVFPCAIISPETSGWFKKEINTPEDLKGLNMRFFGLGASVMEKMGVSTSQLPGGEIFGALEKGAIDATEFSQPAIDQRLGLYKIAKYNYFPGWHQQATIFELLINKDTWNDMSKSQQAILDNTCKASVTNAIAEGEAMQFDVMANAKEHGVHIRYWNDTMLTAFEDKWNEVVAEKTVEDPFFKKVWDDLSTFRKGYDLWESNAFLPRAKNN
ncbi:TRAP transporter substrate-binding protein [Amphritea sp. 2_MG-2023]|uniref:TRAP transporter substrate-binding protein n=1 Tax=Amphritea TaxID=515417 RepID=UPI001C070865|nr:MULTISPECIES: TRAP transporter substrate-binding protein [Amphritea]MBU2964365.1 TRAP transporter substrate-binding protein [Amphritea atlantica]MDO6419675.1 TRAP transporter substrate-binding protein [Amphritea sp. 2_MG-2023]MDX2424322.1 TRAP transporter substrate-binding protein [Amphritea sp.]